MPTIMGISTATVFGAVGALQSVAGMFMGGGGAKAPAMPDARVPAQPAPVSRTDAGANVVLGSESSNRVSGRARGRAVTTSGDVLGGLGQSGLNI